MNAPARIRLFVGIKLDPGIARELAALAQRLEGFPVRLVPAADLHLTLVPPWNEHVTAAAIEKLRLAVRGARAFRLAFVRICYGPTARRPRFLWVECGADAALDRLREALLEAFGQTEERPFRPHVTLARIPQHGGRVARKMPIDQNLSFGQAVATIELFRSPPPGSAGYEVLASVPLAPEVSGAASN